MQEEKLQEESLQNEEVLENADAPAEEVVIEEQPVKKSLNKWSIMMICSIAVFAVCLIVLGVYYYKQYKAKKIYDQLQEEVTEETKEDVKPEIEDEKQSEEETPIQTPEEDEPQPEEKPVTNWTRRH